MAKKTLCSWDKEELKEKLDKLKKIVSKPEYVCLKCGRAAKKDEYLCKPEKL